MPKPRIDRPRQPRVREEQRAMPAQVCFPNTAFETKPILNMHAVGCGGAELWGVEAGLTSTASSRPGQPELHSNTLIPLKKKKVINI